MKLADMHCHILPGIDDGAPDEEMSRRMLRLEAGEGTDTLIFTPHYKPGHRNAGPHTIRRLTARMQEIIREEQLAIRVYTGNEILYHDEVPELLGRGEIMTLADSDHALIEFAPTDIYEHIRGGLYEVMAAGFVPVLAHAERYLAIVKQPDRVDELVSMGAKLQLNVSTVMGKHGLSLRRFARGLIAHEKVHFIATDAHDDEHRAPQLAKCARWVAGKYGRSAALRLFYDNALELTDSVRELE